MSTQKILALTGLVICISGCSGLQIIKCPDGEPVTVVKNIEKAYPVYAAAYDFNLKAVVKASENVNVDATADLKRKIERLRQDLDQESSRVQMLLQTALLGLQTTPCDLGARKRFSEILQQVNENSLRLSQIAEALSKDRTVLGNSTNKSNIEKLADSYQRVK